MPRPPAGPKSASRPKPPPLKKQSPRQAAKAFREDALAEGKLARQYDLRVAAKLKSAVEEVLARVRFGKPLEASEAPRPGPGGHLVAPNGDPLIRVKLSEGPESGRSQYALVSPRTNQFYKEDNVGAPVHVTHLYGPLSLPRGSHLGEKKHNRNDLDQLESAANRGPTKSLSKPALLAALAKLIKRGDLAFDGQATTKEDTLTETVLKKDHPFTYLALVRKDDPTRVIIKKVMTGGFVPAGPNDGAYSQPFALK